MDCNLMAFSSQPSDRLILIKEQHLAESNFVFAHLMQQALADRNNQIICLLIHNSIGHFISVGMRLEYNFVSKLNTGVIKFIDVQELILQSIENPELDVLSEIQKSVNENINEFMAKKSTWGKIYVFIDDFTDLHDCTLDLSKSINFLNNLLGLHYNDTNVMYIIGLHMGNVNDKILSSDLEYSADCIIDISVMSTGRSVDVDGVMKIVRNRKLNRYHYKVKDYGVQLAIPGKFIIS